MPNLYDAIKATGSFDTFLDALGKAALIEWLKSPGPLTVFVPTNEAFARVDPDKRENVLARAEKVTRVMQYHIVSGFYTTNDLLDHILLKTLEGQRLRIDSLITALPTREKVTAGTDAYHFMIEDQVTTTTQQSLTVNNAMILQANQRADNGVFHTIDQVLVPKFLMV